MSGPLAPVGGYSVSSAGYRIPSHSGRARFVEIISTRALKLFAGSIKVERHEQSALAWIHRPMTWRGSGSSDRSDQEDAGSGLTSSAAIGTCETKSL